MQPPSSNIFEKIRRLQLMTHHLAEEMMSGLYHSAFKGQGMEFEEVREYQPGDEVRHIDWNVTARMQHPYTKVFREEREMAVWLLIDISPSVGYGSQHILKREYIAEVVALLAFAAAKNNDRVGALFFSDRIERALAPKQGSRHAMHIVREAMVFMPQGQSSNLEPVLRRLGHMQRRRCICFVISDFLYPPAKKAVQMIAGRHDLINVMVSDPSEETFPVSALVNMADKETREEVCIDWQQPGLLPLKRYWQEHIQLIQACGADIIQLSSHRPSLQALRRFFRLRAMHGRGS